MKRKSPIKHIVHQHKHSSKIVKPFIRGKGKIRIANPNNLKPLSRRDFPWTFYKVDMSREGNIGVHGKGIELLTDGNRTGALVETALYYEGDSYVYIFDRTFYVRLIDARQKELKQIGITPKTSDRMLLVRDEKTDNEWLLPWNDTMKRKYGRTGEKRFSKQNVVADILNKILIPAKISKKFKFIEHYPDKTELEK